MADDSGIDPRYAAQFQRGYDPSRDAGPPPAAAAVRLPGGPLPTAERVPLPPSRVERSHEVSPAVEQQEASEGAEPVETHALGTHTPGTRILEWAPLGVALVLIAFAVVTFSQSATDTGAYSGNFGMRDYMLLQARNDLPGPLLVAGVLAITVWLAVRPVRARRSS